MIDAPKINRRNAVGFKVVVPDNVFTPWARTYTPAPPRMPKETPLKTALMTLAPSLFFGTWLMCLT